jgi:hypothetical protein
VQNRRKFLRLEVNDFLEIRPVDKVAESVKGKVFNLTLMGICFSADVEWEKGQILHIEYFMAESSDAVKMKVAVVWSEQISDREGILTGAEIIDIEPEKELKFVNFYFKKLKEKYFD